MLSTILTMMSVALGVGLVLTVLVVKDETEQAFNQTSAGYDLILAAKGSPLQSTLNTLYHIDYSTGLIPYAVYEASLNDPRVEKTFPFYVGDQYKGFRVIGSNSDFLKNGNPKKDVAFSLLKGRIFDAPLELVAGSSVARNLNIQIGDNLVLSHGLIEGIPGAEPKFHEGHTFRLVGILNPTFTANDQVLFADVRSLEAIHKDVHFYGHSEEETSDNSQDHNVAVWSSFQVKDLDAVLVKMKNSAAALQVAGTINYPIPANPIMAMSARRDPYYSFKNQIMAVIPSTQIQSLLGIVGQVENVLRYLAYLVAVVGLIGTLVALYNTMEERKRDIAIMRSLGAKRPTVSAIIVLEAASITGLGSVMGLFFMYFLIGSLRPILAQQAGLVIGNIGFHSHFALVILLMVAFGSLCGLIPALKAYRTNVLENLIPSS